MSKRRTLYYIFGTTLVISALIVYFFSMPLVNNINTLKNDLQAKNAELSGLKDKESSLKKIDASYNKYKQQFDLVAGALPKTKDVSGYITQLEGAASQSQISLKSIKIGGQTQTNSKEQTGSQYTQLTKVGDLYVLPIDLSVSGNSFGNLLTFIETTENLSRFTTIQKFSIKNNDTNKSLDISLTLNIYVLP